jgi:hypothetical protein
MSYPVNILLVQHFRKAWCIFKINGSSIMVQQIHLLVYQFQNSSDEETRIASLKDGPSQYYIL